MNSIDRHLGVQTKAATLLTMRSAKKEILLVVEGDADISVLADALGVPRSNFLSCNGKEILMGLFNMAQTKGIDEGTIFVRDRDFDNERSRELNGVLILVTDRYDIEMELLENRIFGAILLEYSVGSIPESQVTSVFKDICIASGSIGAMRLLSKTYNLNLDFDELKYNRFFDPKKFTLDLSNLLTYIFAKSNVSIGNCADALGKIEVIIAENAPEELACSKETIDMIHLFLSRKLGHTTANCSSDVISRTIRIATNFEDIKSLSFFSKFQSKVERNIFNWTGKYLG